MGNISLLDGGRVIYLDNIPKSKCSAQKKSYQLTIYSGNDTIFNEDFKIYELPHFNKYSIKSGYVYKMHLYEWCAEDYITYSIYFSYDDIPRAININNNFVSKTKLEITDRKRCLSGQVSSYNITMKDMKTNLFTFKKEVKKYYAWIERGFKGEEYKYEIQVTLMCDGAPNRLLAKYKNITLGMRKISLIDGGRVIYLYNLPKSNCLPQNISYKLIIYSGFDTIFIEDFKISERPYFNPYLIKSEKDYVMYLYQLCDEEYTSYATSLFHSDMPRAITIRKNSNSKILLKIMDRKKCLSGQVTSYQITMKQVETNLFTFKEEIKTYIVWIEKGFEGKENKYDIEVALMCDGAFNRLLAYYKNTTLADTVLPVL